MEANEAKVFREVIMCRHNEDWKMVVRGNRDFILFVNTGEEFEVGSSVEVGNARRFLSYTPGPREFDVLSVSTYREIAFIPDPSWGTVPLNAVYFNVTQDGAVYFYNKVGISCHQGLELNR